MRWVVVSRFNIRKGGKKLFCKFKIFLLINKYTVSWQDMKNNDNFIFTFLGLKTNLLVSRQCKKWGQQEKVSSSALIIFFFFFGNSNVVFFRIGKCMVILRRAKYPTRDQKSIILVKFILLLLEIHIYKISHYFLYGSFSPVFSLATDKFFFLFLQWISTKALFYYLEETGNLAFI